MFLLINNSQRISKKMIQLTSPEIVALKQKRETLIGEERNIKSKITVLRERQANGSYDPQERESNVAMILSGGDTLAPDLKDQIAAAMKLWGAIDDAKNNLNSQIRQAERVAAAKILAGKKSEHDTVMRRFVTSLMETHAVAVELLEMKRELIDAGVGISAEVCGISPEFLDPMNPYSPMADFFRAAKDRGYIKNVPSQLRIAA
jgi:hypothetical protein